MRLSVDPDRCEGHGLCEAAAPGLIQLSDDVRPVLLVEGDLPAELDEQACEAASCCPVAALTITRSF